MAEVKTQAQTAVDQAVVDHVLEAFKTLQPMAPSVVQIPIQELAAVIRNVYSGYTAELLATGNDRPDILDWINLVEACGAKLLPEYRMVMQQLFVIIEIERHKEALRGVVAFREMMPREFEGLEFFGSGLPRYAAMWLCGEELRYHGYFAKNHRGHIRVGGPNAVMFTKNMMLPFGLPPANVEAARLDKGQEKGGRARATASVEYARQKRGLISAHWPLATGEVMSVSATEEAQLAIDMAVAMILYAECKESPQYYVVDTAGKMGFPFALSRLYLSWDKQPDSLAGHLIAGPSGALLPAEALWHLPEEAVAAAFNQSRASIVARYDETLMQRGDIVVRNAKVTRLRQLFVYHGVEYDESGYRKLQEDAIAQDALAVGSRANQVALAKGTKVLVEAELEDGTVLRLTPAEFARDCRPYLKVGIARFPRHIDEPHLCGFVGGVLVNMFARHFKPA